MEIKVINPEAQSTGRVAGFPGISKPSKTTAIWKNVDTFPVQWGFTKW
jgi:hypothetical protein